MFTLSVGWLRIDDVYAALFFLAGKEISSSHKSAPRVVWPGGVDSVVLEACYRVI